MELIAAARSHLGKPMQSLPVSVMSLGDDAAIDEGARDEFRIEAPEDFLPAFWQDVVDDAFRFGARIEQPAEADPVDRRRAWRFPVGEAGGAVQLEEGLELGDAILNFDRSCRSASLHPFLEQPFAGFTGVALRPRDDAGRDGEFA